MIRYFGDVPYSTVPVLDMTTFSSSRVDRDEIYDGIIADLQEAVEVLPWYSEDFSLLLSGFPRMLLMDYWPYSSLCSRLCFALGSEYL